MNFNAMLVSFRFKNNRMKRIVLFLLAFCAIIISCKKVVRVPLNYSVENAQDTTPQDVYLMSTGTAYVDVEVKFLGGPATDSVTLEVRGVPAGITVSPSKATGIPTYYYKYVYTTKNMPVGTYPVSIVSSAPGTVTKTYNYNLIVIPADCGTLFIGNLNGSNNCSVRDITYVSEVTATDTANKVSVNNLGGYGLNTNTIVKLDCEHDSLHIASQNIGNGVTMSGYGTFTSNKMVIYYSAVATPGAPADVCTATLSK